MYQYVYPTYVGMENSYRINILVNGKIATKYTHDGDQYIEGRKGSEYEIELINDMMYDAEFIVSIDGLSITDGEPAGVNSKGYIVKGRSRSRIKGWLLDDKTAATFKFGEKSKSYAAQSENGDINNSGVIGLLVFARKPDYNHILRSMNWSGSNAYEEKGRGISLNTSSMGMGALYSSTKTLTSDDVQFGTSLGTEFGKATDFKTTTVEFERASNTPTLQTTIFYGDAADLNRLGIVLDWQKKPQSRPDPFPADSGYCKPPKNWKK